MNIDGSKSIADSYHDYVQTPGDVNIHEIELGRPEAFLDEARTLPSAETDHGSKTISQMPEESPCTPNSSDTSFNSRLHPDPRLDQPSGQGLTINTNLVQPRIHDCENVSKSEASVLIPGI